MKTLKQLQSLKPKHPQLFSLESLDSNAPPHSLATREISQTNITRGSYLTLSPKETFAKFATRVNNLYLGKMSIDKLSFSGFEIHLQNLKYLDLSDNKISRIENLESFQNLEVLQLQWNSIRKIENLDKNRKLRVLNLSNNCIAVLQNIDCLIHLKELCLAHQNSQESLNLAQNSLENSVALTKIDLEGNLIDNLSELRHLREFRRKSD